ncbi:MAG: hypothetical protein RL324_293 [Verrucomicrobiota bacterium]|jgi:hypothetical protein
MKFVPGLILLAAAAVPGTPEPGLAPAGLNFTLSTFTKQGYHNVWVRGSRAEPVGSNRWDVTDMRLVLYTGDAKNTIETVIVAAKASFLSEDNVASGTEGVRLIRDDLEVSGGRWSYDHGHKTLVVENNVEVTIHAVLPAILQ